MTVSNISNSITAPQPIEPAGDSAPVAPQPAPVEQIAITDPYELTLSVLAFIASTPASDTVSAEVPVQETRATKAIDADSPHLNIAA